MTTTYSVDADVQSRLELEDTEFTNLSKELVLDRWRLTAFRNIALEFQMVGGAQSPTTADVAAADDQDPLKMLVEIEAHIAAALFRENRIELLEEGQPMRDKSWVWKKQAMRWLGALIRHLNPTSRVRATKDPVDD